jgi:predicted dehydrogenase
MSEQTVSRRGFLGASATTGLALGALAGRAGGAPAERLSVGIVGPGGRGRELLKTFFDVGKTEPAELTAVCDLWSVNRERGAALVKMGTGKEPRVFRRLEDMLAWKGLDAVLIATPDHAHARHLVQCLEAGKHIYCEKPFANVLEEANSALDACRKSDRVVTIGTQRRSDPRYLAAADLMRSGEIGPVVQVEVIQNAYSPYRWRRPANVKTLKEADTDWKAFLMGKPARDFDPHQYLEFRLYHDFSTGIIDQWMTHMIDTVHMLSGARYPRSVVAHGGTYAWKDGRENGDTVHALLDYPEGFMAVYSCTLANGFGSACRVLGRQGTLEHEEGWRLSGQGVTGSKVSVAREIAPREGLKGDMDHIHMENWLECVRRGERQTHCTPEAGHQHAVACIMADRALHGGRRLVYEEKSRTIREG